MVNELIIIKVVVNGVTTYDKQKDLDVDISIVKQSELETEPKATNLQGNELD